MEAINTVLMGLKYFLLLIIVVKNLHAVWHFNTSEKLVCGSEHLEYIIFCSDKKVIRIVRNASLSILCKLPFARLKKHIIYLINEKYFFHRTVFK